MLYRPRTTLLSDAESINESRPLIFNHSQPDFPSSVPVLRSSSLRRVDRLLRRTGALTSFDGSPRYLVKPLPLAKADHPCGPAQHAGLRQATGYSGEGEQMSEM